MNIVIPESTTNLTYETCFVCGNVFFVYLEHCPAEIKFVRIIFIDMTASCLSIRMPGRLKAGRADLPTLPCASLNDKTRKQESLCTEQGSMDMSKILISSWTACSEGWGRSGLQSAAEVGAAFRGKSRSLKSLKRTLFFFFTTRQFNALKEIS